MFGFIPAWALWLSGGWAAKTVAEKMKPVAPAAGVQRGPYPGGPPSAQVAPQPPPQQQQMQGPPAPRAGSRCQFDPHMDERTERAVVKYLTEGDVVKLRGFADSVTTNLPPQYYPHGYFPMAAFAMRMQAQMLEQQRAQAAATAQQRAQATSPPAPIAHVPAPSPKANGAVTPAVVVDVTPEVMAHPES